MYLVVFVAETPQRNPLFTSAVSFGAHQISSSSFTWVNNGRKMELVRLKSLVDGAVQCHMKV